MLNGWQGSNITNPAFAAAAQNVDSSAQAALYAFAECYSNGMTQPLLNNNPNHVFVTWAATFCSYGNGFSNSFLVQTTRRWPV